MATDYDRFARFYDLEYQKVSDDLELYRQFALRCKSPVLELGSGTGRILLHLARAGFRVTGVDSSAPMLEITASLSYANSSAFTRAFRRWSGRTPTDWRQRRLRR
jgi:AraC-like DNA-binding protein